MTAVSVSLVIPAFNEGASVAAVVAKAALVFEQAGIEHEIIVVDDGSTDATAQNAQTAGARVLRNRTNRGYGASLKTGILAAQYETICIADADGSYPVDRIPDLLAEATSADMVVGARVKRSAAIPFIRRPAKWFLKVLAQFVTKTRIPDLNSGMRVFSRSKSIDYFNILSDEFSFTTTITMAMLCDKYAVKYVPIDYAARIGQSKIVPWDAVNFTALILRVAMLFRPLRVFLPCASVLFCYAVTKAFWDILITGDRNISATAILAMLTSIQLVLIGALSDALGIRLRYISGAVKSSNSFSGPENTTSTTQEHALGGNTAIEPSDDIIAS